MEKLVNEELGSREKSFSEEQMALGEKIVECLIAGGLEAEIFEFMPGHLNLSVYEGTNELSFIATPSVR
jgi:hypothetical protein